MKHPIHIDSVATYLRNFLIFGGLIYAGQEIVNRGDDVFPDAAPSLISFVGTAMIWTGFLLIGWNAVDYFVRIASVYSESTYTRTWLSILLQIGMFVLAGLVLIITMLFGFPALFVFAT